MAMAGETLDRNLRERLVDALLALPGIADFAVRSTLLEGIPATIGLNRSNSNHVVDLTRVVSELDALGRLDNGERPVAIVAHNAWRMTRGTELGRRLAEVEREVEAAYGGDAPSPQVPAEPEILIFGGPGEWVSTAFLEQARQAGRQVARLLVPRLQDGQPMADMGLGTGWLAAPGLMFTNHHVVEARDPNEPRCSEADFRRQGAGVVAWFDYQREGQHRVEARAVEVVSSSRELDYALLRLEAAAHLAERRQMSLARGPLALARGARLNIVQCPGGGPLTYAIRNNFYVGGGDRPFHLRYLTDTRQGSSGSPVLDDTWQVVALHHGYQPVRPELYKGEAGTGGTVKFHNEGTAIPEILAHVPAAARDEIARAQSWA
jgi:hypothetical protein